MGEESARRSAHLQLDRFTRGEWQFLHRLAWQGDVGRPCRGVERGCVTVDRINGVHLERHDPEVRALGIVRDRAHAAADDRPALDLAHHHAKASWIGSVGAGGVGGKATWWCGGGAEAFVTARCTVMLALDGGIDVTATDVGSPE